jgi:oligopeptide/dipeptide ABC transporter ATP-binding protein
LPTIVGSVPAAADWPVGCHFQDRCALVQPACRAQPVELVELPGGRLSRCVLAGRRDTG